MGRRILPAPPPRRKPQPRYWPARARSRVARVRYALAGNKAKWRDPDYE